MSWESINTALHSITCTHLYHAPRKPLSMAPLTYRWKELELCLAWCEPPPVYHLVQVRVACTCHHNGICTILRAIGGYRFSTPQSLRWDFHYLCAPRDVLMKDWRQGQELQVVRCCMLPVPDCLMLVSSRVRSMRARWWVQELSERITWES